MQLKPILATMALSLLAVHAQSTSDGSQTTTLTSTATMTRTIRLERVVATTTVGNYGNGTNTATFMPTGSGATRLPTNTPSASPSPISSAVPGGDGKSGSASLAVAHLAAAGIAGLVAAALL